MLTAVSCLSPVSTQILMSALDRLEMVSGTPYIKTQQKFFRYTLYIHVTTATSDILQKKQ